MGVTTTVPEQELDDLAALLRLDAWTPVTTTPGERAVVELFGLLGRLRMQMGVVGGTGHGQQCATPATGSST